MTEQELSCYLDSLLEKTKSEFPNNKILLNEEYKYEYAKFERKGDDGNKYYETDLDCGMIVINIYYKSKFIKLIFYVFIDSPSFVRPLVRYINAFHKGFNIEAYDIFRKSGFDSTCCHPKCTLQEIKTAFNPFFAELKKLIATEEMQKILNTDYTIEIPDWVKWEMIGK